MCNPRLTVLTVVHNGERYLDRAIESILAQDFADYEYLIVDDGSTDNSPQILQRWAERDPRIVVECLPRKTGIARALNRGLTLARGQYIGRQDADDICVGTRLRRQVDQLDREPDVVLVSANYTMIDGEGRWEGNCIVENPPALFPYLLNFSNALGGAGSQGMFRRDTARELGGFREDLEVSVDYEFWTRLAPCGRIVILPFVGLKYRLHSGQSSVQLRELQHHNSLMNSRRMLTAYLDRTLSDEEFAAVASIWRQEGRTGVVAAANRVLREAYARFSATETNPRYRQRVRLITATRWFLSATVLIRRGSIGEAARHLGWAFLWHPFSLGVGVTFVANRLLVRIHRMIATAARRP